MNIYDEGGALDYEKASAEVKATASINDERQFSRRLALIKAAAAVDVAASLSILALESSIAIGPAGDNVTNLVGLDNDESVTADDLVEEGRDFLVVGDVVHVTGAETEPGEVVKLGVDQGETYADVVFVGGKQERYYERNLVRIREDGTAADIAERMAAAFADVPPPDVTIPDDPDEDFDPKPAKKKGKKS